MTHVDERQRDVRGFGLVPGAGSYRPTYRTNAVNRCPGCRHTNWHVGRFSAECAFCGTALPLQEGSTRRAYPGEKPAFFTRGREDTPLPK